MNPAPNAYNRDGGDGMTEKYTDIRHRTHRVRHTVRADREKHETREEAERRIAANLARILLHGRK